MNVERHQAVVIGGGPAGLAAAIQLKQKGIDDVVVLEREHRTGGILRQCIHDGFGLTRFRPIPGTEERVDCDTLILSVGLIPAGDIANGSGLAVDGRTKGAFVDEHYQTSIPGVFSAGNVLHVHDLVDFVSLEAEALAAAAAEYLQKGSLPPCPLEVKAGANVGHVIPQHVSGTRSFTLSLRVRQPLKKVTLTVTQNGREVLRRKFPKALPAEMIQLTVPAEKLETAGDLEVSVQ